MNKPKEIRYLTDECPHENLKKIAPMWYYCLDCGRVFNFILSLQFSFNEAVDHWSKIVSSLDDVKKAVRKAEKKAEKKEEKAKQEAIKKYKENLKNVN